MKFQDTVVKIMVAILVVKAIFAILFFAGLGVVAYLLLR